MDLRNKINQQADLINNMKAKLQEQNELLIKQLKKPYGYAYVLRVNNDPNPELFVKNKQVRKTNPNESFLRGKIVGDEVKDGKVLCDFRGILEEYKIGSEVCLWNEDDGTYVTILIDDKPLKVDGYPELNLSPGDTVLISLEQSQPPRILSKDSPVTPGLVVNVTEVFENGTVEVSGAGNLSKVVIGNNVEKGDKVVLDYKSLVIIDKLPKNSVLYSLTEDVKVEWDEIGGLSYAKKELQRVIEWPITKKKLFEHYKIPATTGVLLYGPPGCGKSLIAKACYTSLARSYGKEVKESGFIYCKGPEILNMYVGNTEHAVRDLFRRGKEHYNKHNYPAILFIDEADALLRKRGSDRSSSILDTTVPQFLAEMSGLEESRTIVMLATNRPDMLDPAVTRDGRIDKRIKIKRPDKETSVEILKIHLKDLPLWETDVNEVCSLVLSDVFSKSRTLYKINKNHVFYFSNILTGSMLKAFVEEAKMFALERDNESELTGIRKQDFRSAIEKIYNSHLDINHDYDIQDYAEEHDINGNLQVEKYRVF